MRTEVPAPGCCSSSIVGGDGVSGSGMATAATWGSGDDGGTGGLRGEAQSRGAQSMGGGGLRTRGRRRAKGRRGGDRAGEEGCRSGAAQVGLDGSVQPFGSKRPKGYYGHFKWAEEAKQPGNEKKVMRMAFCR